MVLKNRSDNHLIFKTQITTNLEIHVISKDKSLEIVIKVNLVNRNYLIKNEEIVLIIIKTLVLIKKHKKEEIIVNLDLVKNI